MQEFFLDIDTTGIATQLTELAIGFTTNKYVMLLIINVVFLMAGCVMDNTSALYIIVPNNSSNSKSIRY